MGIARLVSRINIKRCPFGSVVYLIWLVIVVMAILPMLSEKLRPLWRLLGWVAPTILALDVDAGNHFWIYFCKSVLWVLGQALVTAILMSTDGLSQEHEVFFVEWTVPVCGTLLLLSCALTITGHNIRRTIWVGDHPAIHAGQDLHPVDVVDNSNSNKPTYADFNSKKLLKIAVKPADLSGAWVPQPDGSKRALERQELNDLVLRTSFMTEFVMRRTFKTAQNKTFVYSMVAWHRTRLLVVALTLAGLYHVGEAVFTDLSERDIVNSILLWLTLPTITLPALLRLRFGTNVRMKHLFQGLLPVDFEQQMASRLGISREDLFSALTNRSNGDRILNVEDDLWEAGRGSKGHVAVLDMKEALGLSADSLVRIGDKYRVRISDGAQFLIPDKLEGTRNDNYSARRNATEQDSVILGREAKAQWRKAGPQKNSVGGNDNWRFERFNGYLKPIKPASKQRGSAHTDQGKTAGIEAPNRTTPGAFGRWKRADTWEDRETLVRELANAFYRNELTAEQFDTAKDKAMNAMTHAQVRAVLHKVATGAGVVMALGGVAALVGTTIGGLGDHPGVLEERDEDDDEEGFDDDDYGAAC